MIRSLFGVLSICCSMSLAFSAPIDIHQINFMPPGGAVPNEKIAVSIAKIVLSSVYGVTTIERQQPLNASLIDGDKWLVSGTANGRADIKGGVAYIVIRKQDGSIIGMISEK